ncbi:hypothetical protein ACROYT_G030582 [Oculina patagonica]
MCQTGKLTQAAKEMDRYRMDFIRISEARSTGSGMIKEDLLWTRRQSTDKRSILAIIIAGEAANVFTEWKPLGEILIMARFNFRVSFKRYHHAHDVLCVIGDFNARVGSNNEGRDKIIRKNGCGNINDNGRRLCDLCAWKTTWPFE